MMTLELCLKMPVTMFHCTMAAQLPSVLLLCYCAIAARGFIYKTYFLELQLRIY